MTTTIHEHATSPLQRFVHLNQTQENADFQVSPILNLIICTFYSPEGTDSTSNLRLYTSDITKLVQDLGLYGPHFELTIRASIPSISIWFFGDFSKPNFIIDSLNCVFRERPIFAQDQNLIEVFQKFIHINFNLNTNTNKRKEENPLTVLFRREKHSILTTWLQLFKSKPFSILFKSLAHFMTTQYYDKQNSLQPQIFGIKSL